MVVKIVEEPPGPPVRSTFVAEVHGDTVEGRQGVARELVDRLRSIDGVVDIDTSITAPQPRLIVEPQREKARSFGLSAQTIGESVSVAVNPQQVSQYHPVSTDTFLPIELSFPEKERDAPNDLSRLQIKSRTGELIPLESVANTQYSRVRPVLFSKDQRDITYVTAEVENRSIVYAMIDLMQEMAADDKVSGMGLWRAEYTDDDGLEHPLVWGGEWKMTLENFRDLGMAMLVAFFAVYILLVGKYRSFLIPALLMTTAMFGIAGILPGFALLDAVGGIYLTATALIGFIALIGIVVNNAIIYLEYVLQLQNTGQCTDIREALVEAGKVRMRPILLTSMTTVLASLTIAFDPVWSGLAWSIVFGLSLSALMTLVIFPVLYVRFVRC